MQIPEWLVPEAQRVLTPFRTPARLAQPVDLVVLHYTASPFEADVREAARIRRWLSGQGRESSTHFVIRRNGEVIQGVPLTDRAWHVVDAYPHEGRPINRRSIALDFASVGFLEYDEDGALRDDYRGRYTGPPPFIDAKGRPWEPITPAQVAAATALLQQIGEVFPALRAPGRLIAHSDVQRTRSDPGPSCPRADLEIALQGEGLPATCPTCRQAWPVPA